MIPEKEEFKSVIIEPSKEKEESKTNKRMCFFFTGII